MKKGTSLNTFKDTFKLSTNIGGPILYSNNHIRSGKNYFGPDSLYFTSIEGFNSFLLGAHV
jgi:hypothetical protein